MRGVKPSPVITTDPPASTVSEETLSRSRSSSVPVPPIAVAVRSTRLAVMLAASEGDWSRMDPLPWLSVTTVTPPPGTVPSAIAARVAELLGSL